MSVGWEREEKISENKTTILFAFSSICLWELCLMTKTSTILSMYCLSEDGIRWHYTVR
jgi:hypothetical protein